MGDVFCKYSEIVPGILVELIHIQRSVSSPVLWTLAGPLMGNWQGQKVLNDPGRTSPQLQVGSNSITKLLVGVGKR